MRPLLRILSLWRAEAGWLLAGFVVTLAALGSGIALLTLSGATVALSAAGGVLVAPVLLRRLGVTRVVLRYCERLFTHEATFRALASLRVWFFRGLARSSAGGLSFRHAGDVLSRLVADIEAMDGLYIGV